MDVIDYGASFVHGSIPENRVRFWVESRTRIIDEKRGTTEDYFQCGACKSEETFAEKGLFRKDNYDFLPIFGPIDGVVFRRFARGTPDSGYRQIAPAGSWWGELVYRIKPAQPLQVLDNNEKIRRATHAGLPLVVQTEIWDERTTMRAIIEYPVKTMNIHDERNMYQVDTGPVAFPDLSTRYDRAVESISLAYVAINAPHFADFVRETRTPIAEADKTLCEVYHYSDVKSLPAKNTLFCVGNVDEL